MKICSVDGCGRRRDAKELCSMHYRRLKKGTPLLAPVATAKGEVIRYIDEVLVPHQGDDCLEWRYHHDFYGRPTLTLNLRPTLGCRYICTRAHGEPPEKHFHAAHECGHHWCCNPRHLSWKTPKENMDDKLGHGTFGSKITKDLAIEIYSLKDKVGKREMARRYNVNRWTIKNIWEGRSWVLATGATPKNSVPAA